MLIAESWDLDPAWGHGPGPGARCPITDRTCPHCMLTRCSCQRRRNTLRSPQATSSHPSVSTLAHSPAHSRHPSAFLELKILV